MKQRRIKINELNVSGSKEGNLMDFPKEREKN